MKTVYNTRLARTATLLRTVDGYAIVRFLTEGGHLVRVGWPVVEVEGV